MRFARFLVLLIAAAVVLTSVAALRDRLCFKGGDGYTFYLGTSSADCREVAVKGDAAFTRFSLKGVCGESTVYDNFDLEKFLSEVGGKIVAVEELSDSVNYYCTANLPYSVNLYGKRINLHVSMRGDTAKVGSPIIFGGY